jgi:hypothetical protein
VDLIGGDLARLTQTRLIEHFAGPNLVFRETLPRKLDQLRAEIVGTDPTPLERLLVERVVTCWLRLHLQENRAAARSGQHGGGRDDRAVFRAQRIYLAAIKTLATVRKLAVPALQVNIAKKQASMAGTAS